MSGGAANKLESLRHLALDAELALSAQVVFGEQDAIKGLRGLDQQWLQTELAKWLHGCCYVLHEQGEPVNFDTLNALAYSNGHSDEISQWMADVIPKAGNRLPEYLVPQIKQWQLAERKLRLVTEYQKAILDCDENGASDILKLLQRDTPADDRLFSPDGLLDLDNLPPIKWLFHELIPIGQVSVLCSPGNLGKSRLAIGLIATVVLGRPLWRDFYPQQQGRVLYLSAEDSLVTVLHRLKSYRDVFGLDKNAFAQAMAQSLTLHCESGHNFCEFNAMTKTVNTTPYYNEVLGWCEKKKPALIVVDTLSDHAGGINENDNGQAKIFMKLLKQIAVVSDGALLLIHHTGKGAETEESSNALRGASAIANSARAVFLCKQEGCAAEVRVHLTKANLSRRTGEAWAFDGSRYAFTELGVSSPPLCQRNVDLVVDTLVKWVNDNPGKATAAQLAKSARGDPEVRIHCVLAHNWATGDVLARAFKIAVNQGYVRLAVGADKKSQCLHPGDTAVPVKQASAPAPETTETDDGDDDDDNDSGMLF